MNKLGFQMLNSNSNIVIIPIIAYFVDFFGEGRDIHGRFNNINKR